MDFEVARRGGRFPRQLVFVGSSGRGGRAHKHLVDIKLNALDRRLRGEGAGPQGHRAAGLDLGPREKRKHGDGWERRLGCSRSHRQRRAGHRLTEAVLRAGHHGEASGIRRIKFDAVILIQTGDGAADRLAAGRESHGAGHDCVRQAIEGLCIEEERTAQHVIRLAQRLREDDGGLRRPDIDGEGLGGRGERVVDRLEPENDIGGDSRAAGDTADDVAAAGDIGEAEAVGEDAVRDVQTKERRVGSELHAGHTEPQRRVDRGDIEAEGHADDRRGGVGAGDDRIRRGGYDKGDIVGVRSALVSGHHGNNETTIARDGRGIDEEVRDENVGVGGVGRDVGNQGGARRQTSHAEGRGHIAVPRHGKQRIAQRFALHAEESERAGQFR